MAGLSKISVQSGTSHGGVVLADGSIADVKLDLDTLELLSKVAREEYGLAGAVQHGASTLPDDGVQQLPADARRPRSISRRTSRTCCTTTSRTALRDEIYEWLRDNAKDERKATDSDEQFFYKTRKKALGPFKRQLWDLPADGEGGRSRLYDAKFGFLFTQLGDRQHRARSSRSYVKPPDACTARCRRTATPVTTPRRLTTRT